METPAAQRYAKIVATLLRESGVTLGSRTKGFGSTALKVNNKIFAMLSSKGKFVIKLSKRRVDMLAASGSGERFDPGHGRLMKEWLAVSPDSGESWLALAREAMTFVAAKR